MKKKYYNALKYTIISIICLSIVCFVIIGTTNNPKENKTEITTKMTHQEATETTKAIKTTEQTTIEEKTKEATTQTTTSVTEVYKPEVVKTTKVIETTKTTEKTEIDITNTESSSSEYISLGEFKLTAYCNCSTCCGKWSGSPTASGAMPKANHTIAVDTSVIPFGTEVIINGNTYVAEDTGSAIKGNKIDIYMSSHEEALNFGVQYAEVFVVNE